MKTRHRPFHAVTLAMVALAISARASERPSGTATSIASVASFAGTWTVSLDGTVGGT